MVCPYALRLEIGARQSRNYHPRSSEAHVGNASFRSREPHQRDLPRVEAPMGVEPHAQNRRNSSRRLGKRSSCGH